MNKASGFWLVTAAILATLVAVQVSSIRHESQTWDEGFEIASGYSFLKTGEYRISPEQPPLARMLAAIPLLWLNPEVPTGDPSWANRDDRWFGHAFVFQNRVAADDIVFWARMPTIFTTAALGFVLAWWTRRTFGAWAAIGCLWMFAFDPNIVAIGRYVKNDMLVALLALLSVAAWAEYLERGKRRWLLATGLVFGLAIAAKFPALFLLPVFAVSWFAARWQQHRGPGPVRCVGTLAALIAAAIPVVLLVYAPEWRKLLPATRAYRGAHPEARRLADGIHVETARATLFTGVATHLGMQDHPLLVGLARFLDHASGGHQAYLLGRVSTSGWWYYFPVAFIVKTPVATLSAIGLAIALAIRRWWRAPAGWLRSLRIEWLLCAVPIAVYIPLSMANKVNTGERHLFPIYPFLFILTASILARMRWRARGWLAAGFATMLVLESASIYPHYLAFFNFAVGGPGAGSRYLVDSNLDWGQDLLNLRDYWIARGRPTLCTLYFGTADQDYYGLQHEWVPRTWQTSEREAVDCLAAVSATPLRDVYERPGSLQWLREREPVAKIGYSIYVYDLRKPKRPTR